MLPFIVPNITTNLIKYLPIALLSLFVLYKWYDYTSTIDDLNKKLESEIQGHNVTKLEAQVYISDIDKLRSVIEEQNKQISSLSLAKDKAINDFNNYKSLPLTQRVSDKELKSLLESNTEYKNTCEYGLELNKRISKLRYEDL